MTGLSHGKVRLARGPDGGILSISNLPAPSTTRWVVRRKAEVVWAVRGRVLTVAQACERYNLSLEEFQAWERAVKDEGVNGLRATRPRDGRRTAPTKVEGALAAEEPVDADGVSGTIPADVTDSEVRGE